MPERQDNQNFGSGISVEPRAPQVEQPSCRSIGMNAILNPSHCQPTDREQQNGKKHGLDSPSRSPSQTNLQRELSSRPRRIITPISPGTQGANPNIVPSTTPGTINAVHSPFIQSPESQASASAQSSQESAEGPKRAFSVDFRRFSYPHPPPQLTPPYEDRRPSSGELSDPRSHTGSPSTPHSLFSQFSRTSPGPGQLGHQQPSDSSQHSQNPFFSNWNAPIQHPQNHREPQRNSFPQLAIHNGHDIIPIEIDVESASSRANEKRSSNRDASKRHRDRKKDAEAEKARTLELQEQKIKFLTEERDHYQSELEYFRDIVNRTTGLGRIPPRPLSPRHRRPMPLPAAKAANEKTSSSQTQERGSNSGRNTRRKLNQEQPGNLPTPPPGASLAPLPPLNYSTGPVQQQFPGSWPAGAAPPPLETGNPTPQHHVSPYPSNGGQHQVTSR